jgi:hypothetical protein
MNRLIQVQTDSALGVEMDLPVDPHSEVERAQLKRQS